MRWNLRKIKEVALIRPPKKLAKSRVGSDDLVSVVPMECLGIDKKFFGSEKEGVLENVYSKYVYFENDDVVIAKITPCFENGKIGVASGLKNGIGFGSSEFIPFRCNDDLCPAFLYHFMDRDSFRNEGSRLMTGAVGHKRIPKDFYEEFSIPIPPLEEQERIVEVLDEAFAAIDKAKANIERNLTNARELFQSRLNDIFSNPSEDWEVMPLGEVCKKIQDGAHHSPKELFSEGGRGRYRYLTSKHIRPLELQWEKSQWCSKDFHETIWPRCNPEFGDVLLTKDGSNTGNVCLFSLEEPVSLLSSVCVLKADRSIVRPAWILFFILSPMGFKMVTGKMTGAAIRRIILKTIKAAEISFPGVAEQDELIEMMFDLHASVLKVETQYQSELDNLEELRQSILEQAFEGKLTEPVAA